MAYREEQPWLSEVIELKKRVIRLEDANKPLKSTKPWRERYEGTYITLRTSAVLWFGFLSIIAAIKLAQWIF